MTALPEFLCGGLFVGIFAVLIHRRIVGKLIRAMERQQKISAELHRDVIQARELVRRTREFLERTRPQYRGDARDPADFWKEVNGI